MLVDLKKKKKAIALSDNFIFITLSAKAILMYIFLRQFRLNIKLRKNKTVILVIVKFDYLDQYTLNHFSSCFVCLTLESFATTTIVTNFCFRNGLIVGSSRNTLFSIFNSWGAKHLYNMLFYFSHRMTIHALPRTSIDIFSS
jgi:hypothetical protein